MTAILSTTFISMFWCGLLLPRRRLWISALVLIAVIFFFCALNPGQVGTILVSAVYLPIAALAGLGILALASAVGFASGGLIRERDWSEIVKGIIAMAITGAVGIFGIVS
jgi:hypothetical protein